MLSKGQLWSAMHELLFWTINSPLMKGGLTVPAYKTVAEDSNTPSTSSKSVVSTEIQASRENRKSKITPEPFSQPDTSGVKEGEINLRLMASTSKVNTNKIKVSSWQVYLANWEKLYTRQGINPSKARIDVSGKYPRVRMLPGSNPHEVKQWYDFGALASIQTMSPAFPEIKCLPKWIQEVVQESWANNDSLSRGDIMKLYLISAAPEPAGKGNHEAFHYIRLRRPYYWTWGNIKASSEDIPLIVAATEDQITTRRA